MKLLSTNIFQMNNAIFHYSLTAHQLAVYCYLRSCSGSRDACKVKVQTIAAACGCSQSTVRRALKGLEARGFIDIKGDAQAPKSGGRRQTCNRYYLLDESEWQAGETA